MSLSKRMYTVPGRFLKYFWKYRVNLLLVNLGKFKGNPLENSIFILSPSALRNFASVARLKIVCYFTASLPASFLQILLLPLHSFIIRTPPAQSPLALAGSVSHVATTKNPRRRRLDRQ